MFFFISQIIFFNLFSFLVFFLSFFLLLHFSQCFFRYFLRQPPFLHFPSFCFTFCSFFIPSFLSNCTCILFFIIRFFHHSISIWFIQTQYPILDIVSLHCKKRNLHQIKTLFFVRFMMPTSSILKTFPRLICFCLSANIRFLFYFSGTEK